MFDEAHCVSLERRPDRWATFLAGLPCPWSLVPIQYHQAIDGRVVPPAAWWKQGVGAWGCYRSHLRLIEDALNRGVKSLLLLEDDATFVDDFDQKLRAAYAEVPSDWEILYLGGQHLRAKTHPPRRLSKHVVVPWDVNRTHAWALRGEGLRKAYRHLTSTSDWRPRRHVDHRMGELVRSGHVAAYALDPWLVGQREGKSDVSSRDFDEPRFWDEPVTRSGQALGPLVAIVGLHRSGSSCLAGVLHELGFYMGRNFGGCEPDGGYESRSLARTCEQILPFPKTSSRVPDDRAKQMMLAWLRTHTREAQRAGVPAGAKYPHLCALGRHLRDALGEKLRVIHASRPLEESIASLVRRSGKRRSHAALENVQRFLWDRKTEFLATVDHFTVEYSDLLSDPAGKIGQLAGWLSVRPTESAVNYVKPGLRNCY